MRTVGSCLIRCLAACVLATSPTYAADDLRLVHAAKSRNRAAVEMLLHEGVGVNAALPDGATALHWLVHWNDVPLVSRLLQAGADITAANSNGVTAIEIASINGDAAILAAL